MSERFSIGKIGRLQLTAEPSAAAGALLLWVVFSLLGLKAFRLKAGAALTGGLLTTILHFVAELWHQNGHARAAERTGHPMDGVHLWGVLGTSIYPADEPELPAEIHVERALGGPRASAVLTVAAGAVAALVRPFNQIAFMVASVFALENMVVFNLGAFLPLPFLETDGTTLQRYRNTHRKRMVVIQE